MTNYIAASEITQVELISAILQTHVKKIVQVLWIAVRVIAQIVQSKVVESCVHLTLELNSMGVLGYSRFFTTNSNKMNALDCLWSCPVLTAIRFELVPRLVPYPCDL